MVITMLIVFWIFSILALIKINQYFNRNWVLVGSKNAYGLLLVRCFKINNDFWFKDKLGNHELKLYKWRAVSVNMKKVKEIEG